MNQFVVPDLAGLSLVTDELAKDLRGDDIFLLSGDLGAGKTSFVREFVAGLQTPEATGNPVASPTYALHHRYLSLRSPLTHVDHWDLYRVKDLSELDVAGFWEILETESGLVFVEWPELIPEHLWPRHRRCRRLNFQVQGSQRLIRAHLINR